jgi:hypothetical protein
MLPRRRGAHRGLRPIKNGRSARILAARNTDDALAEFIRLCVLVRVDLRVMDMTIPVPLLIEVERWHLIREEGDMIGRSLVT